MQIIAYHKALLSELTRNIAMTYSRPVTQLGDPIGLQIDCKTGSFTVHHMMRDKLDMRWSQFLNLLEGYQLERAVSAL